MRRIVAGILAISSGVRPSGSGSSAGSPSGSEPSGSSRAARWPCVRWALSSDVAACTACSSSSVGAAPAASATGAARGRGRGRRGAAARAAGPSATPRSPKTSLVEAVLALQQRLDAREEAPGLRALDDAVVVGRGHRHDLLGADHRRRRCRGRPGRRSTPVATIVPWPVISRGTEATVPMPPGLVSEMFAPGQVVGGQLVRRARGAIRSLKAARKSVKGSRPASRMTGTISVRVPSFFSTSTAMPRLTCAVVDAVRLAVDLGEVVGHDRHVLGRRDGDRVGDQVREGDLLARPP